MLTSYERDSLGRRSLAVAGLLLVLATMHAARWRITPTHTYGDTYHYLALSYDLAGQTTIEARRSAGDYSCSTLENADERSVCVEGFLQIPERYRDIFESRVGYPLVSSPFVALFGPSGLTLGSALLSTMWALALFFAVREAGGTQAVSLLAAALAYTLPTGQWAVAKLPEGGVYLGLTLWLLGALKVLNERSLMGSGLMSASVVWLAMTKLSSAVALCGVSFAIAAVAALSTRNPVVRRPLALIASFGLGAAAVLLLVSSVMGLPGLNETLQDMYTSHFQEADIDEPLLRLLRELPGFVVHQLSLLRDSPIGLLAFGASLAAIAVMACRQGRDSIGTVAVWCSVGLAGVPLVLVHPVLTEVPRLISSVWIPVAAGFAYVIEQGVRPGQGSVSSMPGGAERNS